MIKFAMFLLKTCFPWCHQSNASGFEILVKIQRVENYPAFFYP